MEGRQTGSESGLSGKGRSFHHWGDRRVKFFLVLFINSLNKYKSKQKNRNWIKYIVCECAASSIEGVLTSVSFSILLAPVSINDVLMIGTGYWL